MEKSISFKPVLWRLVIWKFVPIYIGLIIGMVFVSLRKGYPYFPLLQVGVGGIIITIIFSIIYRKEYDIVISGDKISGQGAGNILMGRETFSIGEIDRSQLYTQTLSEKIFVFRTIRSINKRRIIVSDFLYGKATVKNLYTLLEEKNLAIEKSNIEKA
jgi:hypothetical protein